MEVAVEATAYTLKVASMIPAWGKNESELALSKSPIYSIYTGIIWLFFKHKIYFYLSSPRSNPH